MKKIKLYEFDESNYTHNVNFNLKIQRKNVIEDGLSFWYIRKIYVDKCSCKYRKDNWERCQPPSKYERDKYILIKEEIFN